MDDTVFTGEIGRQPAALRKVAGYYRSVEGSSLMANVANTIRSKRKLVITGMGTSLYAPYFIYNELAGTVPSCEISDAGELLHFGLQGFHSDEALLALSQSGESAETKRVVQALKGRVPIVSVVNDTSSSMAKNSDLVLPILAGDEASISTKTYTNTLAVLLLLSTHLAGGEPDDVIDGLYDTSHIMEKNLAAAHALSIQAADFFSGLTSLHVIARGRDLVTARQLALILKEGAGIFTEALSAGLFRHGPIELSGKDHSAIFIVSRDNESGLTEKLAEETAVMGSRILIVSDTERDISPSAESAMYVHIPNSVPRYFPLLCAPFIEYFVHETAKKKEKVAGVFSHATKITAKE